METVQKEYAVEQVRLMACQFADLYFAFCLTLRRELGDEAALRIARETLFLRARERALDMVRRAERDGVRRVPENIARMSDVPYLGWVKELGREHCPYGAQWNRRIADNAWFRPYAALYCDVTDTTIAEVFTGTHSHKLDRNVVLGDADCARRYFPSEDVARGRLTYEA